MPLAFFKGRSSTVRCKEHTASEDDVCIAPPSTDGPPLQEDNNIQSPLSNKGSGHKSHSKTDRRPERCESARLTTAAKLLRSLSRAPKEELTPWRRNNPHYNSEGKGTRRKNLNSCKLAKDLPSSSSITASSAKKERSHSFCNKNFDVESSKRQLSTNNQEDSVDGATDDTKEVTKNILNLNDSNSSNSTLCNWIPSGNPKESCLSRLIQPVSIHQETQSIVHPHFSNTIETPNSEAASADITSSFTPTMTQATITTRCNTDNALPCSSSRPPSVSSLSSLAESLVIDSSSSGHTNLQHSSYEPSDLLHSSLMVPKLARCASNISEVMDDRMGAKSTFSHLHSSVSSSDLKTDKNWKTDTQHINPEKENYADHLRSSSYHVLQTQQQQHLNNQNFHARQLSSLSVSESNGFNSYIDPRFAGSAPLHHDQRSNISNQSSYFSYDGLVNEVPPPQNRTSWNSLERNANIGLLSASSMDSEQNLGLKFYNTEQRFSSNHLQKFPDSQSSAGDAQFFSSDPKVKISKSFSIPHDTQASSSKSPVFISKHSNSPPAPPVRDASSLKYIKYGPGHEKFPSWPVPAGSANQVMSSVSEYEANSQRLSESLTVPTGSHRSKSWTEQSDYQKDTSGSYVRPHHKKHLNQSYQQHLKTVLEKSEKLPANLFESKVNEDFLAASHWSFIGNLNKNNYYPMYDRDGHGIGDKDYNIPSPPERDPGMDDKFHVQHCGPQCEEYPSNYDCYNGMQETTPLLDQLREESAGWDGESEKDSGRGESESMADSFRYTNGRESVTTVVTNSSSASSSETLKWHGSLSDISIMSSQSRDNRTEQSIAHSSRVLAPQRHNSESVLYYGPEKMKKSAGRLAFENRNKDSIKNGKEGDNIPNRGYRECRGDREVEHNNEKNNLKKFPSYSYSQPLSQINEAPVAEVHESSTHSAATDKTGKPLSIAERITEFERQSRKTLRDQNKVRDASEPRDRLRSRASLSTSDIRRRDLSEPRTEKKDEVSTDALEENSRDVQDRKLPYRTSEQSDSFMPSRFENHESNQHDERTFSQNNSMQNLRDFGNYTRCDTQTNSQNYSMFQEREKPTPLNFAYLDPKKQCKVPDSTLKNIQKRALLSFYERRTGKSLSSSVSANELTSESTLSMQPKHNYTMRNGSDDYPDLKAISLARLGQVPEPEVTSPTRPPRRRSTHREKDFQADEATDDNESWRLTFVESNNQKESHSTVNGNNVDLCRSSSPSPPPVPPPPALDLRRTLHSSTSYKDRSSTVNWHRSLPPTSFSFDGNPPQPPERPPKKPNLRFLHASSSDSSLSNSFPYVVDDKPSKPYYYRKPPAPDPPLSPNKSSSELCSLPVNVQTIQPSVISTAVASEAEVAPQTTGIPHNKSPLLLQPQISSRELVSPNNSILDQLENNAETKSIPDRSTDVRFPKPFTDPNNLGSKNPVKGNQIDSPVCPEPSPRSISPDLPPPPVPLHNEDLCSLTGEGLEDDPLPPPPPLHDDSLRQSSVECGEAPTQEDQSFASDYRQCNQSPQYDIQHHSLPEFLSKTAKECTEPHSNNNRTFHKDTYVAQKKEWKDGFEGKYRRTSSPSASPIRRPPLHTSQSSTDATFNAFNHTDPMLSSSSMALSSLSCNSLANTGGGSSLSQPFTTMLSPSTKQSDIQSKINIFNSNFQSCGNLNSLMIETGRHYNKLHEYNSEHIRQSSTTVNFTSEALSAYKARKTVSHEPHRSDSNKQISSATSTPSLVLTQALTSPIVASSEDVSGQLFSSTIESNAKTSANHSTTASMESIHSSSSNSSKLRFVESTTNNNHHHGELSTNYTNDDIPSRTTAADSDYNIRRTSCHNETIPTVSISTANTSLDDTVTAIPVSISEEGIFTPDFVESDTRLHDANTQQMKEPDSDHLASSANASSNFSVCDHPTSPLPPHYSSPPPSHHSSPPPPLHSPPPPPHHHSPQPEVNHTISFNSDREVEAPHFECPPPADTVTIGYGRNRRPEELECHQLSVDYVSEFALGRRMQALLAPGPELKTTADYMTGVFSYEVRKDVLEHRSQLVMPKYGASLDDLTSSTSEYSGTVCDTITTSSNTTSNSPSHKASSTLSILDRDRISSRSSAHLNSSNQVANFATLGTQETPGEYRALNSYHMKDARDGQYSARRFYDYPASTHSKMDLTSSNTSDHSLKKTQLMASISRKLEILRAEQDAINEEVKVNDGLGSEIVQRVEQESTGQVSEKFKLHIEEVDKITSLLLGLSARLARAENALLLLAETDSIDLKQSLESKRDRLSEQLEEALSLKDNIDRRATQLEKCLSQVLSAEELTDYDHFLKLKAKLIMDSKEVADKIKLGEEQLAALMDALDQP